MLSDLGELKDVKGVFDLKNSQILANLPCSLATLRNLRQLAALRLAQRWRLRAM
ncbi:hypothetical protein QM027_05670 [Campylobacter concisus]